MITLNKVAKLQKESQNALSIFEKTVSRLNKVNESIAAAKIARANKIDKLQGELFQLEATETKNSKLANKLYSFLED